MKHSQNIINAGITEQQQNIKKITFFIYKSYEELGNESSHSAIISP